MSSSEFQAGQRLQDFRTAHAVAKLADEIDKLRARVGKLEHQIEEGQDAAPTCDCGCVLDCQSCAACRSAARQEYGPGIPY